MVYTGYDEQQYYHSPLDYHQAAMTLASGQFDLLPECLLYGYFSQRIRDSEVFPLHCSLGILGIICSIVYCGERSEGLSQNFSSAEAIFL